MQIPEQAVGISVYRFKPLTGYTAAEMLGGGGSIDTFFRRVRLIGGVCSERFADGVADIFDKDMDTVESIYLNRKGIRYCYKKLGLRVVNKEST